MINSFSLTNFKNIDHLDKRELRPITILCGANSCGKSSILQSILLMKQTLESKDPNQSFLLNGRLVHLGSLENIIHGKNLKDKITFNFRVSIDKNKNLGNSRNKGIPLKYLVLELIPEEYHNKYRYIEADFSITFGIKEGTPDNTIIKPISIDAFQVSVVARCDKEKPLVSSRLSIHRESNEQNNYTIEFDDIPVEMFVFQKEEKEKVSGSYTANVSFRNGLPEEIVPFGVEKQKYANMDVAIYSVNNYCRTINILLRSVFSSVSYIGPLREEPSRRYIYEDEITEIGAKGENAAYIYLSEQHAQLNEYYIFDERTNEFRNRTSHGLIDAVNEWLDIMGIKGFGAKYEKGLVYLDLLSSSCDKLVVNIADVGFGVSQIFPIILEGLRMSIGNTLILEQPEIHLHPNLQMCLADYFISLALSGKNVIIETHSDHIVNRLVRRIVEDNKNDIDKLVSIYFIKPNATGIDCDKVEIDEHRGIVNWPKDFFDQTANEQEKIIQACIRKRKSNRTIQNT